MAINLANPVNWNSPLNRGLNIWSSNMVPGLPMGKNYRNLVDPKNNGTTTGTSWAGIGPANGANSVSSPSGSNTVAWSAGFLSSAVNASYCTWIYRSSTGNSINLGTASAVSGNFFGSIWFTDGNIYTNCTATYSYSALSGTGWHHLAVVFDGSQSTDATRLVTYVDGVAQSVSFAGVVPSSLGGGITEFKLFEDQSARYGTGNFSDFRMYSRSLSSNEVKTIYKNSMLGYREELNRVVRKSAIYSPATPSFKSAWARGSNVILQPGVLT